MYKGVMHILHIRLFHPLPREGATHKVSLYGVKCYFNCKTNDLWGVNNMNEYLISVVVTLHNTLSYLTELIIPSWEEQGFPLKIIDEYVDFY